MRVAGLSFVDACAQLGARDFAPAVVRSAKREQRRVVDGEVWIPVMPDADAPLTDAGVACSIWNPKRGREWRFTPSRADAYHDATGRLLGYVLCTEIIDRVTGTVDKITPQVTWCIGPDGSQRWCLRAFPTPRPMLGLDALAAMPDAPVLVVEGENVARLALTRCRSMR